ncbi:kinase-like domain, beta-lactamase/transpeptidase-like protein [Tanacetum coccineum]
MLAEKVKRVVRDVVGEEQNAFIKGRYILDRVLIANETMEFLKNKKEKGLIFKVDFEKAYDIINWRFLLNIMKRMRSPSEEFVLERGVRQGDPLSPFLYILAAKGLNVIVNEAVEWNKENAKSLMCILKCFEEDSGLRVNYNKSKLYGIGVSNMEMAAMARWMGCDVL